MKRQIVVFSGFNRALLPEVGYTDKGTHKSLLPEWSIKRFQIWKKYTWMSIKNQTHKDWLYCVCCDKRTQKVSDRLFNTIKDKRLLLTYSETYQEEKVMKKIANNNDEVILVRVDSDDMYHPLAFTELMSVIEENEWFLWRKGYCYQFSYGDYKLAKQRMKTYSSKSGPFHAHRYIDPTEWAKKKVIREVQHKKVITQDPYIMPVNRILVGITEMNTTTLFRSKCFPSNVIGEDKEKVLKEFKIK